MTTGSRSSDPTRPWTGATPRDSATSRGRATPRATRRGEAPARTRGRRSLWVVVAAILPGLGHLLLGRRRTGSALLGGFALAVAALAAAAAALDRTELLRRLVSSDTLIVISVVCVLAALGWAATIVRVYRLARPSGLPAAQRAVGVGLVALLCAVVVVPLGFAANLANSQRALLDSVFPTSRGGGAAGDGTGPAPASPLPEPRLNVLLLGTDDAPGRDGARTDTMIVASVDTDTAETILFALPRNIQHAPFPPGSPAAARFPDGFHDPDAPNSGRYLLNAVYGYGVAHPALAPPGPTADPGINLLMSSIEQMLALHLHHYIRVDMAGLAAIVDALGGVTVDVGAQPLPIGGVTATGRLVEPRGFIPPGVQHLDGQEALWFARARRNSDDYDRMARQRCLIDAVLAQNGPGELLLRFRSVADAAAEHISTSIPRSMLPALVSLVDETGGPELRTVSFDPDLPDPTAPGGTFRPADPDFSYMRQVVRDALPGPDPATAAPSPGTGTGASGPAEAHQAPAPAEPSPTCASSALT